MTILEALTSPEAIDALRGGLFDNPCVVRDLDGGLYYFADEDLKSAIEAAFKAAAYKMSLETDNSYQVVLPIDRGDRVLDEEIRSKLI